MNKSIFAAILYIFTMSYALPVFSITNGEYDENRHPAVVLIIMEINNEPAFRCSGVLLDQFNVLTAGHCTGEPGQFSGLRIFTESNVDEGNNNYPYSGPNAVEAESWASHPDYTNSRFFVHDVGVIKLAQPVILPVDAYAALPTVDMLDRLATQRGLQDVTFTAVGYGLQRINPVFVESERARMFSAPRLIQINAPGMTGDYSLLLSNNHATGGTCFGDSGGPNFLGESPVVAGVTSFGLNGNCAGTGGVFRLDRQNVLDFINDFISQ